MKNYLNTLILFLLFAFTSKVLPQVMPLNYKTDSITYAAAANKNSVQYMIMTLRTAPSFTLQMSGFYNYGVFELAGNNNGDFSPEEFESGENFGVRHGAGLNIVAKVPLHKNGNIRLDISTSYNMFNSKYSKINANIYNLPEFVKYRIYSGGIGIENNFTPSFKIKTLVGASLIGSVISGNANVILDQSNTITSLTIKPAFRLGINVFSGFEYQLNDNIGLNFGIQFTHANLWLKNSTPSSSKDQIYLNDSRQNINIPFSGWKQFAYGSFFGGVNIYFGVDKKDYVYRKY